MIQHVEHARFVAVERLPDSARGDGGYGSTGGFLTVVPDPDKEKQ